MLRDGAGREAGHGTYIIPGYNSTPALGERNPQMTQMTQISSPFAGPSICVICVICGSPALQMRLQKPPRMRRLARRDLLGRSRRQHPPAAVAALGPQVDDVV